MERKLFVAIVLVFVFLVCLILCVIQSAYGEDFYILCRPDSKVNIRSKPRKNSAVVAWIECGQMVHTDGREKNGFIHVVDLPAEITEGWIYCGYLADEEPVKRTYQAEVYEGSVIARSSMGGRRLCKLKEGKIVTVYAKTHSWAVTNKGYILCDWLREIEQ